MKFKISSREFKAITERAGILCDKKSPASVLRGITLVADFDKKILSVRSKRIDGASRGCTNFDAQIRTENVEVFESGEVCVEYEDVKKLYSIAGELTIETDGGGEDDVTLRVHGGKKQVGIKTGLETADGIPVLEDEFKWFTAGKSDFLDTLSKLDVCRAVTGVKPVHRGFNLQENGQVVRVATVNEHRLGIRNTNWQVSKSANITVPGETYKDLKKISANKQDEDIDVYTNRFAVRFVGKDFEYAVDVLLEDFMRYENVLPTGIAYSFNIKAKDLYAVAKEYYSMLDKDNKYPMYFTVNSAGKFVTGISVKSVRTTDVIDIETDNKESIKDLLMGFQPAYIRDGAAIFGDETIRVVSGGGRYYDPWVMSDDNGYQYLLLPVRLGDSEYHEAMLKLLEAA